MHEPGRQGEAGGGEGRWGDTKTRVARESGGGGERGMTCMKMKVLKRRESDFSRSLVCCLVSLLSMCESRLLSCLRRAHVLPPPGHTCSGHVGRVSAHES